MAQNLNPLIGSLPKTYPGLSDIHLLTGKSPSVRFKGDIVITNLENTSLGDMEEFFQEHMTEKQFAVYIETGDMDYAVIVEDQRFRANAFKSSHGHCCVLRLIVTSIPDINILQLPKAVHQVLNQHAGLVLVTGQTGSGKSTSLAAMIDKLNKTRHANIITIEDPIEFVHSNKQSIISQREVGRDTQSFASAIKAALREDPDVILLG